MLLSIIRSLNMSAKQRLRNIVYGNRSNGRGIIQYNESKHNDNNDTNCTTNQFDGFVFEDDNPNQEFQGTPSTISFVKRFNGNNYNSNGNYNYNNNGNINNNNGRRRRKNKNRYINKNRNRNRNTTLNSSRNGNYNQKDINNSKNNSNNTDWNNGITRLNSDCDFDFSNIDFAITISRDSNKRAIRHIALDQPPFKRTKIDVKPVEIEPSDKKIPLPINNNRTFIKVQTSQSTSTATIACDNVKDFSSLSQPGNPISDSQVLREASQLFHQVFDEPNNSTNNNNNNNKNDKNIDNSNIISNINQNNLKRDINNKDHSNVYNNNGMRLPPTIFNLPSATTINFDFSQNFGNGLNWDTINKNQGKLEQVKEKGKEKEREKSNVTGELDKCDFLQSGSSMDTSITQSTDISRILDLNLTINKSNNRQGIIDEIINNFNGFSVSNNNNKNKNKNNKNIEKEKQKEIEEKDNGNRISMVINDIHNNDQMQYNGNRGFSSSLFSGSSMDTSISISQENDSQDFLDNLQGSLNQLSIVSQEDFNNNNKKNSNNTNNDITPSSDILDLKWDVMAALSNTDESSKENEEVIERKEKEKEKGKGNEQDEREKRKENRTRIKAVDQFLDAGNMVKFDDLTLTDLKDLEQFKPNLYQKELGSILNSFNYNNNNKNNNNNNNNEGNNMIFGLDLLDTQITNDTAKSLINDINYRWHSLEDFLNCTPTLLEIKKYNLKCVEKNGKKWWYNKNYQLYIIPSFFKFMQSFNKLVFELLKRVDQLYYFLAFEQAQRVPYYMCKWWCTYRTFQQNKQDSTNNNNYNNNYSNNNNNNNNKNKNKNKNNNNSNDDCNINNNYYNYGKPRTTTKRKISYQFQSILNDMSTPKNFLNYIIFRTKRRINNIIETLDFIYINYSKMPDLYSIFNIKLIELHSILHKKRYNNRLKFINSMFYELPGAFVGPFRGRIVNWIKQNQQTLKSKPRNWKIRDKYKRFYLTRKHWLQILTHTNHNELFEWININNLDYNIGLYNVYGKNIGNRIEELEKRKIPHFGSSILCIPKEDNITYSTNNTRHLDINYNNNKNNKINNKRVKNDDMNFDFNRNNRNNGINKKMEFCIMKIKRN